jgi:RHS repeat-associated protein
MSGHGTLPRTHAAAGTLNATLAFDYGYDADGLLTEASAEGHTLTLTRDAGNGALIATALGTITTEHGDNAFGEPETVTALHGPDTLFATHYTRDKLGRITGIEETIVAPEPGEGGAAPRAPPTTRTLTYTYDAADRLHSWSIDGQVQETYGYDPNGNRTHVNGAQVARYDDQDRLVAYTPLHPRPIPTAAVGYRIDPQQRRIARTEDGEVTHLWVYRDDLNPIAELQPDGSLKSLFVYADNANTPAFVVRIDPDTGNSSTYRYVTDHLGSPRLLVDSDTGAIAQRLDYDPWGRVTQDSNPGFQPFGFAGGLYDPATGLVRFGARDYDPVTGRWMAKDPIGFDGDGANLYGYVLGDPVNALDSRGLAGEWPKPNLAGVVFDFVTHMDDAGPADHADNPWGLNFPFTKGNFRENLKRYTGIDPSAHDAHHVLPKTFQDDSRSLGIDVHNPRFGTWWERSAHQRSSTEYNKFWRDFLDTNPTTQECFDFAKDLADDYGYDLQF